MAKQAFYETVVEVCAISSKNHRPVAGLFRYSIIIYYGAMEFKCFLEKKRAIILFKVDFFTLFPSFPSHLDNGFSRSAPKHDKTCAFSVFIHFRPFPAPIVPFPVFSIIFTTENFTKTSLEGLFAECGNRFCLPLFKIGLIVCTPFLRRIFT